ncbi:diguanylate cyclase [Pleurocapsa sp. PCC 7319]|uniref:sensor domain-containing diguanylate cyclase n=1 Tax=Pleurocapsa sp. PCC 7319 TaxID=118161 RepID=UPI00034B6783|nr:diguanylate cyclase [Pleurocapsa sp. PCC 7319]
MNRATRAFNTNLSIRQILIASLIFQVGVVVGLTGYFSWKNGQKTVEALALRLSREVTSHTQQHVADYLNIPLTFLKINQILAESNRLNLDDLQDLQDVFWQQAQITPQINTLFFGSETGDFIEIEMKDFPKVAMRNSSTAPYWQLYRLDEQGQKTTFLGQQKYDPRQRPWYQAAISQDSLVWSPIYLFADPPVLGITPAITLKDRQTQKIKGVMAIDLTLDEISKFLTTLKISDSGRAFIIEKSGKMVATSTNNSLVRRNTWGNERLHYSDSSDPLIKATADFLQLEFNNFQQINSPQQVIFKFDHSRHFVQATSLDSHSGLDWLIVTVIPESDFIEYIRNNTYTTLLLSVLALILAIFLGAIANQWIIKSVTYISHVAKAISSEQILTIEQQSKIKELAILTESFNFMAIKLQTSAQNIENLESRWEEKVEERTRNLEQVNQELSRLANVDSLTQIYNRYYFDLTLQKLWRESIRERTQIALILCDVDNFKLYNDTYGHPMGDQCLKKVAKALNESINRDQDVTARYGGEEFAIILPRTSSEGAVQVATRMMNAVSNLNIFHGTSNVENYVTISCGIACFSPSPGLSSINLIESADNALYQAKQQGKNCWVMAEENLAT